MEQRHPLTIYVYRSGLTWDERYEPALLYPPHIPFGEEESSFYKCHAVCRKKEAWTLNARASDSSNC
jgi:hypothetical protein